MQKVTADIIYDGLGGRYEHHVLLVDGEEIIGIESLDDHDVSSVQRLDGIIMPGLINTHCHLELSHMLGKVPTGTGLLPFIEHVVKYRGVNDQEIQQAIANADKEMARNGIVAVGDISNKADTALVKSQSDLAYYTFVEYFDFLQPAKTSETISQYDAVYDVQSAHGYNRKSKVPHAPYTVSPGLFDYLSGENEVLSTVSIHNQETEHEDQLFLTGQGGFKDWYSAWGMDMKHFESTGATSIRYAMHHLSVDQRTLFVHNTMTTSEDIEAAHQWSDHVYWATCPRANLYIENRLPYYKDFVKASARMTVGTDSLTSNWSLDIWAEVKTILKYASYLTIDQVIIWATSNGASALGYDHLGSFIAGKRPGVVHVPCRVVDGHPVIQGTSAERLQWT